MCRSIKWVWKCGCYKSTVLERCAREFEKYHTISRQERTSDIECDSCYFRDEDENENDIES